MYPRLRPLQRGQTKPFGHRCAVRCSPHWTSSPKRERNSLTVMMGFLFNRLGFFISDIISSFVRLFKLDIHLFLFLATRRRGESRGSHPSRAGINGQANPPTYFSPVLQLRVSQMSAGKASAQSPLINYWKEQFQHWEVPYSETKAQERKLAAGAMFLAHSRRLLSA